VGSGTRNHAAAQGRNGSGKIHASQFVIEKTRKPIFTEFGLFDRKARQAKASGTVKGPTVFVPPESSAYFPKPIQNCRESHPFGLFDTMGLFKKSWTEVQELLATKWIIYLT